MLLVSQRRVFDAALVAVERNPGRFGLACTVCTNPECASVSVTFIQKNHRFPLGVWCISGSRFFSSFFVEGGALMIVASTIVPLPTTKPRPAKCGLIL